MFLLYGYGPGESPKDNFISPTVFLDVTDDMTISGGNLRLSGCDPEL